MWELSGQKKEALSRRVGLEWINLHFCFGQSNIYISWLLSSKGLYLEILFAITQTLLDTLILCTFFFCQIIVSEKNLPKCEIVWNFFILWWWSNFLLWSLWLSSFGMNCHSLNPPKIKLYNFLLKFQMCSQDRLEMFATGRQSLSENTIFDKIHLV